MRSVVPLAAVILAAGIGLPGPAHAITCTKASNPIERLICGDGRLQSADAAMGNAYKAILKATDDAEIRTMLVASQKRWVEKRDLRLGQVFDPDHLAAPAGKSILQRNLLAAIRDRTGELTARASSDAKLPRLIATALEQRKFAARYTGGAFAGYDTDCDFMPGTHADQGPYPYACFTRRVYQNESRVCTLQKDWATYREYESHQVANIVGGKLKTIATCSVDEGTCPGPDGLPDGQARWTLNPATPASAGSSATKPLAKVDGDAGPDEDQPWLHACLTDPTYPLADPASDGSRTHG